MSETPTPSLLQDWLREKARVPYFAAYRGDLLSIAHALDSLHSALTAVRARVDELTVERNALYAAIKALGAVASGDVWYWQGDGQDFPESFANNSHVVMTGAQARELAASHAARERAEAENNTLRGLLGNSGKPCAHCGLPIERWGECAHGFPGCARADDAQLSDLFAVRAALAESEAERDALRDELGSVLADWNALVRASGSPTNGGAAGHVSALREDAERWRWWYINADFRSDPDMSGNHLWWSCTPPRNLRGGTVEDAIDAARKERP